MAYSGYNDAYFQQTGNKVPTANLSPEQLKSSGVTAPRGYVAPTTPYTPPTGSGSTTSPVITAKPAQDDFQLKLAKYQTQLQDIQNQAAALQQQKLVDQQNAQLSEQQQKDYQLKVGALQNETQQVANQFAETKAKQAAIDAVKNGSATSPVATETGQNAPTANPAPTNASTGQNTPQNSPPQGTSGVDQANQNISNINSQYNQGMNTVLDEKTQNINKFQEKMNQIINGTFPLSADEQAVMTSVQSSLDRQKASIVGTMTEANARGGQEYTPTQSAGMIADKIVNLDAMAAGTMANLKIGFQKNDYDMITKAYEEQDKYLTDKASSLKELHDVVIKQEQDQRDFIVKQAQQEIDNQLKAQDFNYKVAQDTIDNAFKAGQITETQRHNLATEALQKAAQGGTVPGVAPGLPQVSMNGDNRPDPTNQKAFLDSLPGGASGDVATLVKGVANYQLNLNTSPQKNYRGTSGLTQAQVASLVLQYDPTFSESQYATRQAYQKSLTSGPIYQGVIAGNKSINHLIAFADSVSKLPNFSPFGSVNKLTQGVIAPFSGGVQSTQNEAQTEANGLKDELAKFFKGTGASDVKSIDDWSKTLDTGANADRLHGTIQGAINLLAGQLDVVTQSYTSTMGKAPDGSILQPATINKLSKLKDQGYQVDIPGVNYTNKDSYLKYGGTQENLQNAYNQLKAAGLPTTPENILQAAQL